MSAEREAPDYVQSVLPSEIVHQRAHGWPDFHPETFCHRCGRRNICWHVDHNMWNLAVEDRDRGVLEILCPVCFVETYQRAVSSPLTCWTLTCDNPPDGGPTGNVEP